MKGKIIFVIVIFITFILGLCMGSTSNSKEMIEPDPIEIVPDTNSFTNLELNKANFYFVCGYLGIEHPDIVYAQAQLESGQFTSSVFREKNNFLGLYNSKEETYYSFKHWSDCLQGYKDYVQVKWDGNVDYYSFLLSLPYATDPNYLSKIKSIVKRNKIYENS